MEGVALLPVGLPVAEGEDQMVAVPTLLYSTTISYDDDNMETR